MKHIWLVAAVAALTDGPGPAIAQETSGPRATGAIEEIRVVARRRSEIAQDVPIALSVVTGERLEDTGAFNMNRLKEQVPTVTLYSSNPRNTGINIRGLGTTFGLTNDGIDVGVGFYIDGVFNPRPAVTQLDFIDLEQIEVLRGPQGVLFGKNTTAGAIVLRTRAPSFTPEANFEINSGNYGFLQAKASLTGPLSERVAGRLSYSGTQRDGLIRNVARGNDTNTLSNQGVRGQLLFNASDTVAITAAADFTRQRPDGYAQVFAGVAPTLRAPYRQFENIIADLDYDLPTRDPFDRVIDHDTPWKSGSDLGGLSLNVDADVLGGTLTSTTAWRFWEWDPSNDRDFTGLPVLTLSQAPSKQDQWTQEVRWAGDISPRLSAVVGVFGFYQTLEANSVHTEESGAAQWRFSQSSLSPLWQTPGLLDGYGTATRPDSRNTSAALFGQLDWAVTDRWRLLTGLRFNYDKKEVDFNRETFGGLETTDPALLAIKNSVYSPQAFVADVDDTNLSGQFTAAYSFSDTLNGYATVATAFKPVGINVGGLPSDASGQPILSAAVVEPEEVLHFEIGLKSTPIPAATLNLAIFQTEVEDYQTQVNNAQLGVNRGYLANAEKVRVRGAELDGSYAVSDFVSLYGALAYSDAEYVSFADAPVPLELTGGPASFVDISGERLPGVSRWSASLGAEFALPTRFLGTSGELFSGIDTFYRSDFSSSATPSRYLDIDGYALVNARVGYRAQDGWSAFLWARNLFDEEYFEQLQAAAGNAGHYAGVLGDPRTYGATLRFSF